MKTLGQIGPRAVRMTKSNVFFKYFKYSWAQKEIPVSGFQQRHSMVAEFKRPLLREVQKSGLSQVQYTK